MKYPLSFSLILASSLALAQQASGKIDEIKVEPNPARVGQEVRITVGASGDAPTNCGMVVHFDDGSESRQVKISSGEGKFPVTIAKTYANPGNYIIKAEGKKITTHFSCPGVSTANLKVEGKPEAPKPVAPACPTGYKMQGKVGKDGSFTCKGAKGAKKPETPLSCAEKLEYFSNDKSAQLGCRAVKAKK